MAPVGGIGTGAVEHEGLHIAQEATLGEERDSVKEQIEEDKGLGLGPGGPLTPALSRWEREEEGLELVGEMWAGC